MSYALRRRWYLEVIGVGTRSATSLDEALTLTEQVESGRMWRVLLRVGAGDARIVRQGVGRRAA